jgi:cell division septal protein FtsQ
MYDNKGKILGSLIFVLLISCILYLIFFTEKKADKGVIKMITITGNNLLSDNDYLKFTKLDEVTYYVDLSLPVIKDRFEKHPYIKRVDAEYSGLNNVNVVLHEKEIGAILLSKSEPFLITNDYQVLPIYPSTKLSDLPVISNAEDIDKIEPLENFNNQDILQAFKIMEAAALTDENIIKRLSEINLKNGSDVILTFSGIQAPVIFGRKEEAKKMVYLNIIWDTMVEGADERSVEYIDLRFANEIYVGNSKGTGLTE